MKHLFKPIAVMVILSCASSSEITAQNTSASTEAILQSFVDAYKTDPMALTATFGIKVKDEWWYVTSERVQVPYQAGKNKQFTLHNFGPHKVALHKGQPKTPTWYFSFADRATLEKVNDKTWTAATAATKSTAADVVSLDLLDMEGFKTDPTYTAIGYQVLEHFWRKDLVEITRFSRDSSLPTHGAEFVALYTMKDKRVGWFSIGPDQAANADRNLDRGQVPNLFIITKGKGKADLETGSVDLEPGMSVFIAPYQKHVIYNPYKEPLEGILVLFGDNSDFVYGQSYLDGVEKTYSSFGQK